MAALEAWVHSYSGSAGRFDVLLGVGWPGKEPGPFRTGAGMQSRCTVAIDGHVGSVPGHELGVYNRILGILGRKGGGLCASGHIPSM
jgi:hypothetical protein